MRVLVASDLHGSDKGVSRIVEMIMRTDADLVTISGDITHFGQADTIDALLKEIPTEVLAVTGNCDPLEVSYALERTGFATPMNGNIVRRMGWNFCGHSVFSSFPIGLNFFQRSVISASRPYTLPLTLSLGYCPFSSGFPAGRSVNISIP